MINLNKSSKIFASSIVFLAMHGCSFAPPQDVGKQDTQASLPESSINLPRQIPQKPVLIDLSKDSGGEFKSKTVSKEPEWMRIRESSSIKLFWTKLKVHPGVSLKKFFSRKGLSTLWMDELRRSDYFDLATTGYDQVFYVSHNQEGLVNSVFTRSARGGWYYIEVDKTGSFFNRFMDMTKRQSSVFLTPESSLSDLSDSQISAIHSFLAAINHDKSNPYFIALAKGNVKIFYDKFYLDKVFTGHIEIKKAVVSHNEKSFTSLF